MPTKGTGAVCKHWLKGSCNKGDQCSYRHEVVNGVAPKAAKDPRRAAKPKKHSALDAERWKYLEGKGQLDEQKATAAKAEVRADEERAKAKKDRDRK